MRGRRNVFDEEKETRKMLYISGSVLAIAIIAFIVTFVVYTNSFSNDNMQIGEKEEKNNNEFSQASTQIGKSVNEVQNENTIYENSINQNKMVENTTNKNNEQNANMQNNTNTMKIAINTSNMQKENVATTSNELKANGQNIVNNQTTTSTSVEPESKKELKFIKPVEGEIVKEFAKEKLVYSETLREWVTHNGIDIKADKTTIVKASEEGTVKSIKNDPRYGITVVIEHAEGYKTIYSNLLTAEFVTEGEKLKQGQTIGTVGNTATFEIADEPHLHFEILKDEEYINPELYIKKGSN